VLVYAHLSTQGCSTLTLLMWVLLNCCCAGTCSSCKAATTQARQ
jgi:hypothetical protein